MKFFQEIFQGVKEYENLKNCVKDKTTSALRCSGIINANIINSLCADLTHRAFVVCEEESYAIKLTEELKLMGTKASFYPFRDFCFFPTQAGSKEFEHKRINVLYNIINSNCDVIVTTLQAAVQATIPLETLKKYSFNLKPGDNVDIKDLKEKLITCGFEMAGEVSGIGQFAVRGDIFDIFSPYNNQAYRVEFFADEIENIWKIDVDTQRREEKVNTVTIIPCREVLLTDESKIIEKIKASKSSKDIDLLSSGMFINAVDKFIPLIYEQIHTLCSYINTNDMIFINEFENCKQRYDANVKLLNEELVSLLENEEYSFGYDKFIKSLELVKKEIKDNFICFMDPFLRTNYPLEVKKKIDIKSKELKPWQGSIKVLKEDILHYLSKKSQIYIFASSKRNAQKIVSELTIENIPCLYCEDKTPACDNSNVVIYDAFLSCGFELNSKNIVVISYGLNKKKKRNKSRFSENSRKVSSISQFELDDYVVHTLHGIGIFKGVHCLQTHGITKDYIKIQYAREEILYVPVTQLDMVAKYIGSSENKVVKLSSLGSQEWKRQKSKAKEKADDIADKLIEMYSKRMKAKGHAFSQDNEWQRDFELRFEYEETDDQLRSSKEIKQDMQSSKPMDRLLCGDVGFGKTEVAFRAAFKCVQDSKQCAFLVPTTVLALQHYKTALTRFEGFPVNIEFLSRFKTSKEQKEILKKLERGDIDIIIGTHRLVQKDIKFKDLGLVIVDEEQRFGVLQKEKFKNMAENIDILTLSATPIPRTLNMALSGIRDMSSIEEAPKNRLPVQTYVLEYDKFMIIEAIKKELRRNGQIYYLKNNVEHLPYVAKQLQENIPSARIGIAHSKMNEEELSDIWQKLLEHKIDILVCTTIIEAGIDVANVNTLIIEDADKFGLSQLHQIRGRVGRSSHRAYAYLTFKKSKVLTEIATKRLNAIRDYTEFGSGFKISMRDLEIRGAGNLLGGQQHGCMDAVGYDMYVKLLSEAIDSKKGIKHNNNEKDCIVDIPVQAFIPNNYIEELSVRLDVYKKIALVRNKDDASEISDEISDRFGKIPQSVHNLLDISIIRNSAISCGIYEIKQKENTLLLFSENMNIHCISKLISKSENKVLFSAGTKPYISIKLSAQQSSLQVLLRSLDILNSDTDECMNQA